LQKLSLLLFLVSSPSFLLVLPLAIVCPSNGSDLVPLWQASLDCESSTQWPSVERGMGVDLNGAYASVPVFLSSFVDASFVCALEMVEDWRFQISHLLQA